MAWSRARDRLKGYKPSKIDHIWIRRTIFIVGPQRAGVRWNSRSNKDKCISVQTRPQNQYFPSQALQLNATFPGPTPITRSQRQHELSTALAAAAAAAAAKTPPSDEVDPAWAGH
ncbi:hypothetical protein HZ326_1920 [Fusarium oxysporum f. sp. albedinis]|nr:hypothetical protein HZ326_1920 [Fusarium oxysporum f. sp. albedinis]